MTPSGAIVTEESPLLRLAQQLFYPQSSILDRNLVNRALNCSVNSISDDSQEITCVCVCVSNGCLRLCK